MAPKKRTKKNNDDENMFVSFTDEYGLTYGPLPNDEAHTPPVDLPWPDDALKPISINLQLNVRLVPFVGYSVCFNDGVDRWAEEAGWRLDNKDEIDWKKTLDALRGKHSYIQDYIEDVLLEAIGNLVAESAGYDMPAHKVRKDIGESLDFQYITEQQNALLAVIEEREKQFETEQPGEYLDSEKKWEGLSKPKASFVQQRNYQAILNLRSRLLRLKKWDYEFSSDKVLQLSPDIIRFFLRQYKEAVVRWNRIRKMYDAKRPELARALSLPNASEERAKIIEEWKQESGKEFGDTLQAFITEFGTGLVDDLLDAIKIEKSTEYKHPPSAIAIVEAGRLAFKRQEQHFTIGQASQLFKLRLECIKRESEFNRFLK
jgi:hypothetical protein